MTKIGFKKFLFELLHRHFSMKICHGWFHWFTQRYFLFGHLFNMIELRDDIWNNELIILIDKNVVLRDSKCFSFKDLLIPIFDVLKILWETLTNCFDKFVKLMLFKGSSSWNSIFNLMFEWSFVGMLEYCKVDFIFGAWDETITLSLLP